MEQNEQSVQLQIVIPVELKDAIDDYRFRKRFVSRRAAMRDLIERGLRASALTEIETSNGKE